MQSYGIFLQITSNYRTLHLIYGPIYPLKPSFATNQMAHILDPHQTLMKYVHDV